MTVNELLTEICTRTGEGYENWTERAKSAFKKACKEIITSGIFKQGDYPAFVRWNEYVNSGLNVTTPIHTIIGDDYELIDFLSIKYYEYDGGGYKDTVDVDIISYSEYQAYLLNTALITSGHKIAYFINNGIHEVIGLYINLFSNDKLVYVVRVWYDDILRNDIENEGDPEEVDYGAYLVDSYWSIQFRETAIDRAVEILRAEIAR